MKMVVKNLKKLNPIEIKIEENEIIRDLELFKKNHKYQFTED